MLPTIVQLLFQETKNNRNVTDMVWHPLSCAGSLNRGLVFGPDSDTEQACPGVTEEQNLIFIKKHGEESDSLDINISNRESMNESHYDITY